MVGSIYHPPNTDVDKFLEEYNTSLENICLEKGKELILGMDHNLDLLKQSMHKKTQDFVENTLDHSLLPVITKPTRIGKTSATLIDNIIISDKLQPDYTSNILLSDISDHLPCYVEIGEFNAGKKEATKIIKRKMNKENLNKIKADIESINWETLLSDADTSESFNKLHIKILESLDKHAPEQEVFIKNKRKDKPWISKGIANSIRKSKKLFKDPFRDLKQKDKYQNYMKCLNKIKRAAKLQHYQQKCKDYKQNTEVMGINK